MITTPFAARRWMVHDPPCPPHAERDQHPVRVWTRRAGTATAVLVLLVGAAFTCLLLWAVGIGPL